MKFISARSSFAPMSQYTAKRAPVSLAARSRSSTPSSSPSSQCGLGVKSNCGGAPQRRTSTLSASLLPTGTLSSGRLGIPVRMSRSLASASSADFSASEIFSRSSLALVDQRSGVLLVLLELGNFFGGLVALGLQGFGFGDGGAPLDIDSVKVFEDDVGIPCRAGAVFLRQGADDRVRRLDRA